MQLCSGCRLLDTRERLLHLHPNPVQASILILGISRWKFPGETFQLLYLVSISTSTLITISCLAPSNMRAMILARYTSPNVPCSVPHPYGWTSCKVTIMASYLSVMIFLGIRDFIYLQWQGCEFHIWVEYVLLINSSLHCSYSFCVHHTFPSQVHVIFYMWWFKWEWTLQTHIF